MFLGCPHDPGAQGIQKECPCKRIPMFFNIHTSSAYGDIEGVRGNLLKKADRINSQDQYGYTPLHLAAQGNYVDIIRLLLEYGALVDGLPTSKCSPLHRATAKGCVESCKLLVKNGANIEKVDESFGDMRTPLLKACSIGHVELVKFYIEEAGANCDVLDYKQQSMVDIAQPFPDLLSYFEARGITNQVIPVENNISSSATQDISVVSGSEVDNVVIDATTTVSRIQSSHGSDDALDDVVNYTDAAITSNLTVSSPPQVISHSFGLQCPCCDLKMISAVRLVCCGKLVCRKCRDGMRGKGNCLFCK
jgi:hypothetical protein